jgi:hypothetical protein
VTGAISTDRSRFEGMTPGEVQAPVQPGGASKGVRVPPPGLHGCELAVSPAGKTQAGSVHWQGGHWFEASRSPKPS